LLYVTWYAISYEQATEVQGSIPTAFIASDGSALTGNTGCNDFNGTYQAEHGS
jgi:heat shock protein HslJ